jgi:hypothetical protein
LLIPLIISVLFYVFSVRETQDYAIRLNNSVLHSASNRLDLRLEEVDHVASEILDSDSVKLFQNNTTSFSYPYSYKLIETRDTLRNTNIKH